MTLKTLRNAAGIPLAVLTASALIVYGANAADHQEAPATQAQLVADIGDYYAWHDGDDLNLILTFGTFAAADQPATYSSDVLYGFHFDTSVPADGVSDMDIYARFAQDAEGNWGVQVSGASEAALEGPVETVLSNDGLSAWSGLADDPFFFDQTGFQQTVMSGMLSFDPERDDVAGLNVTALALQLPIASIGSADSTFQTWVTTSSL